MLLAGVAAVAVFVVAVGIALLYDTAHPPSTTKAAASASPTPALPSAPELLQAAAAALRTAPSAHVNGAVGGTSGAVQVDLAVTSNGDTRGTLTLGGLPVDVIRTGGRTYVRSQQLVRDIAGSVAASLVGDRWVSLSPQQLTTIGAEQALDTATSLDGIASLVTVGAGNARRTGPLMVDGKRVIEVVTGPTVVDVAADGTPYPLRIAAGEGTALTLGEFGASLVVQPPSSGVVDLDKLPRI
jgi:hypothetical protein